jgi:uncharacterized protein YdeI (YjbR/CyaY-like superfamily)
MGAFKKHASLYFFKGSLLSDPYKLLVTGSDGKAAGSGLRFKSVNEINPDIIREYILEAAMLNERGIKVEKAQTEKTPLELPDYFAKALKKNVLARKSFDGMSPSYQREFIAYITEAKRPETKLRRIDKVMDNLIKHAAKNLK